jgi:hypothetical protein
MGMNERIKELVVRLVPDAFMTYKGYLYHSSDPKVFEHSDPEPLYAQQELEKFAELIVKECALTLESITVPVSQYYEDFDNGYNKALLTGSTVIKQHFGVEE